MLTPIPNDKEQYRIAAALNAHDARITTEASHLAKLKQIKKGLMDDLLSGRVRVTRLVEDGAALAVHTSNGH